LSGPGPVETQLLHRTRRTPICAALIDPEDFKPTQAAKLTKEVIKAGVRMILIGGSTLSDRRRLDQVVRAAQKVTRDITTSPKTSQTKIPVVLFPGDVTGVSKFADAILFSSLLNSTNPYFIVGAQALGAMEVYNARIESIPMGYLVFGKESATSFIGQVNSLPPSKPNLAVIYALAAQYLGMRTLYLEGGSGASEPVTPQVIRAVRRFYDGILITGGGITTADAARKAAHAGVNILVVGNMLQTPGYQKTLEQITSTLKLAE
jgi:phosphoglycerol geranylgeranyltransferase